MAGVKSQSSIPIVVKKSPSTVAWLEYGDHVRPSLFTSRVAQPERKPVRLSKFSLKGTVSAAFAPNAMAACAPRARSRILFMD